MFLQEFKLKNSTKVSLFRTRLHQSRKPECYWCKYFTNINMPVTNTLCLLPSFQEDLELRSFNVLTSLAALGKHIQSK